MPPPMRCHFGPPALDLAVIRVRNDKHGYVGAAQSGDEVQVQTNGECYGGARGSDIYAWK